MSYYVATCHSQSMPEHLIRPIRYANRFLLWHNLLHLKEQGFVLYDMGKLTDDQNVRAFKLGFGGQVVDVYSGYITQSKYVHCYWACKMEEVVIEVNRGGLVISLDFELNWGVHDVFKHGQYNKNLYGVREALPKILELFEQYGIHATWATVGLLFAETKAEMAHYLRGIPIKYKTCAMQHIHNLQK